jgi:hypothetical protein
MKRRIRACEPARGAVLRTMRDLGDPTLLEVQDSVLSLSFDKTMSGLLGGRPRSSDKDQPAGDW